MHNLIMFGLGIAAGIMIIFIIVMVVVMFRLNKKIAQQDYLTQLLSRDAERDRRDVAHEGERLDRMIMDAQSNAEHNRCSSLEEAKKYTDSRIDKAVAGLTLGAKVKD